MTVTKKIAQVCNAGVSLLFATVFGTAGILAAWTSVRGFQAGDPKGASIVFFFSLPFVGGGIAMFHAALSNWKETSLTERLREINPDSPWLWRNDWGKEIVGKTGGQYGSIWLLTLIVGGVGITFLLVLASFIREWSFWILLVLLVPAMCVSAMSEVVKLSRQRKRFGEAKFRLDAFPLRCGSVFSGRISVPVHGPFQQAELALTCFQRRGGFLSSSQAVFWSDRKAVPAEALMTTGHQTEIPVSFEIPRDARPTNRKESIRWVLQFTPEGPNKTWPIEFELPVF